MLTETRKIVYLKIVLLILFALLCLKIAADIYAKKNSVKTYNKQNYNDTFLKAEKLESEINLLLTEISVKLPNDDLIKHLHKAASSTGCAIEEIKGADNTGNFKIKLSGNYERLLGFINYCKLMPNIKLKEFEFENSKKSEFILIMDIEQK